MPFAGLLHCLCWCLANHRGFGAGPVQSVPSRSLWFKQKGAAAYASPWSLCSAPGGMERHFQKRQLIIAQWHMLPWQSPTYPLGKDTWHLHLGTGCTGPSMLPGGCKPPAQTGLICKHRIHGPAVTLAQLEPSSKPEQMLQDISSDAGCSLADFKEPLEMAQHDNYITIFRLPSGVVMPPRQLQYKWDLLLCVSRHDDTFRDADVMRLKWRKRERKAGSCEGSSFLFPEVVHGLLP